MRLIVTTFVGVVFGFLIGLSFPKLSLTKFNISSGILTTIDIKYTEYTNSVPSGSTPLKHAIDNNRSSANATSKKVSSGDYRPVKFQYLTGLFSYYLFTKILGVGVFPRGNKDSVVHMPFKLLNVGAFSVPFHAKINPIVLMIWVPSNPRGAERLPPGIVKAESDLYLRRLWGKPNEDLTSTPKYLVTFTVGYNQRKNIDAAVKKVGMAFSDAHVIVWCTLHVVTKRASNSFQGILPSFSFITMVKQLNGMSLSGQSRQYMWYAKRFLHPDIVAPYDYIFIWDEDLGVEHFNAEEYIKLVRKHGLEISQPGLEPNKGLTWQMTKRRGDREVHKETEEKPGWCNHPHVPPCAAFVEIMAPVFSRDAWRCVWHMIQNDLVHGWGLDFALRKCVEPAHEKIGVVDAQWIVHQSVPSLGNQVRERCKKEWTIFQMRFSRAEKSYYKAINSTSH
ncbi:hypothetical protein Gogos_012050 [Gossypium gossypioides]|uniref:Uncharacterized protein n=1 Tax=Gossypium gossypioides TaxID=34282 RepID=A0A7J9BRA2_GOSGO|nr:hypothetical protein [Gossypium gossypioides]